MTNTPDLIYQTSMVLWCYHIRYDKIKCYSIIVICISNNASMFIFMIPSYLHQSYTAGILKTSSGSEKLSGWLNVTHLKEKCTTRLGIWRAAWSFFQHNSRPHYLTVRSKEAANTTFLELLRWNCLQSQCTYSTEKLVSLPYNHTLFLTPHGSS